MKVFIKLIVLLCSIALLIYILLDKYNFGLYLSQISMENTIEDPTSYIDELRQAMLDREKEVTISYKGDSEKVNEFVQLAIQEVFKIDEKDNPMDSDYLRYCYKGTQITIKGILNSFTITYHIEYNEEAWQTSEVSRVTKLVVEELKKTAKSEVDLIKAIHDYIIINASYDITTQKNTAYECLINRSSVCQGYAQLTYRMMQEAGIDCRIITGIGKGVSHAWNIVRLNDKWYNIDCTWDDPISSDNVPHLEHNYFLKSESDFGEHIRDEEFNTDIFHVMYPMAEKSY